MPRHLDEVWKYYNKVKKEKNCGPWAVCKKCAKEMQGVPQRLRKHYTECWLAVDEGERQDRLNISSSDSESMDLTSAPPVRTVIAATTSTSQERQVHVDDNPTHSRYYLRSSVALSGHNNDLEGATMNDIEMTSSVCETSRISAVTNGSRGGTVSVGKHGIVKSGNEIKKQRNGMKITKLKNSLKVQRDNDVVCTSNAYSDRINEQIGRYFYATNTPFAHADNTEFIKLCALLRPGFKPPSRKRLRNEILDSVFQNEKSKCKNLLTNKTVCMCLDGWSNVHNEGLGLVCSSVVLPTGETFLVDTVDTSGQAHTADYLLKVAESAIAKVEEEFGARVRSFVTDNASNVTKIRRNLEDQSHVDVITYGCSAHILNLLSADIEVAGVKERIVSVVKYFRNKQMPAAWYKERGGPKLKLPQEVRWNTLHDCIET